MAGSAPIAISTCDGCGDTSRAGRAGRAFDSVGIQQHQQRIAFAAAESEVGVARKPQRVARPVEIGRRQCRPARLRPGDRATPAAARCWPPGRPRRSWSPPPSRPRPRHRVCRNGCRAPGHRRAAAAHRSTSRRSSKRTHSRRTAELVRGHAHRRQPARGEVDGQLPDRLNGVAVHRDAEFGCDGSEFGDRHDGADLVVGPHHRHQRDVVMALQRLAQRGRRHRSVGGGGQPGHLGALVLDEPVNRVQHGVVLHRAGDDAAVARIGVAAGPVDPLDGQVVALGAARGEDHLGRARAQLVGDQLTRLLDPAPRRAAAGVQRRGVADGAEHSRHRLDGGGVHRGGGGVIEVDHDAPHDTGRPGPARPPARGR